jgi:hypothetical protein
MKKNCILWVIILGFLLSCAHPGGRKGEPGDGSNLPGFMFHVYEDGLNHLSSVRAGACPMHPSCSSYSKQCFQKHGLFAGWLMSCDRLMRCGRDEMKLSPRVFVDGTWKYYDPVENNDFWWSKNKGGEDSRRNASRAGTPGVIATGK